MKPATATALLCLLAAFVFAPHTVAAQAESRTHVRVASPEDEALHDLLVKAKTEVDNSDYTAAQADYEKYLAQRPNDAAAHFDLGYVYTAQRETDNAIAEYRKAVALDPKMLQAQLNLGLSLLSIDPKGAIQPLQQVIWLNYSFARGHYLLGVAEDRSGNSAAAEKEYVIAVKLDPNDADAQTALGRLYLNEGKGADAEEQFRELLRLKPGDPEAEQNLAQSLLQQKKTADAVQTLTDYLNANPGDDKARVLQASALAQMGKNDEALAALDRVTNDGPETLDSLKLKSTIYYSKSDFPNAVAVLQKAEAMAPRDASIHASLGHAFLETKNYAGAERELGAAMRLSPSSTDTLRDLISAEYLQKDYAQALAALGTLAQREAPNAGTWFLRGSCYDHMGQAQDALDAYQKFLAMNTDTNSNQYFEATQRVRFLKAALKRKGH
jgi:Flp pilus assembly protein TadD